MYERWQDVAWNNICSLAHVFFRAFFCRTLMERDRQMTGRAEIRRVAFASRITGWTDKVDGGCQDEAGSEWLIKKPPAGSRSADAPTGTTHQKLTSLATV